VADSQYWYNLNLVGLRLKTALSTAIYKKSLHLSNSSRKEKTGETFLIAYITQITNESQAKCFLKFILKYLKILVGKVGKKATSLFRKDSDSLVMDINWLFLTLEI
jgi:hypothetical protein